MPLPAKTADFFVVPQKRAPDKLGNIAFLLAPNDASSGAIYTSVPNGAQIRLWMRYEDEKGMTGQIQHIKVNSGYIFYSFSLPQNISSQFLYLEASLRLDESEFPQPDDITSLYGANGEKLTGASAITRPDGCKYLQNIWHLPYPDAQTATDKLLKDWREGVSAKILNTQLIDGAYCITLDKSTIDLGQGGKQLAQIAQSLSETLLLMRECTQYKSPDIRILSETGELLLSDGTDPYPSDPEPPHMVYLTKNGGKYHEKGCKYATGSSETVMIEIAEQQGYDPCKICHKTIS